MEKKRAEPRAGEKPVVVRSEGYVGSILFTTCATGKQGWKATEKILEKEGNTEILKCPCQLSIHSGTPSGRGLQLGSAEGVGEPPGAERGLKTSAAWECASLTDPTAACSHSHPLSMLFLSLPPGCTS